MKAAVIEQHPTVVVRDVPDPKIGEYEALCEILYGAVCSGTDTHIVEGCFPWISPLPTVLGHESIGRVVEVGKKVKAFRVGDLVTRVGCNGCEEVSSTWGGFAELGVAFDHQAAQADGVHEERWNDARRQIVLPPDIDPAAATMFITWRETLSYFNRMGCGSRARLLIIGSGGNGLAFAAHARNTYAEHVMMVGSTRRKEKAIEAGTHQFIDYRSEDLKAQLESSCPDGFDFVIDALGQNGSGDLGLSQLKPGGTIGIYGVDETGHPNPDASCARGKFTEFTGGYHEAESHDQVLGLLQTGRLDPTIWLNLDSPFLLDDIAEAIQSTILRAEVKPLISIRNP